MFVLRAQLISVMAAGAKNRAVAATGMNQGSSRSHSVFIISVQQVRCCIDWMYWNGAMLFGNMVKGFQYSLHWALLLLRFRFSYVSFLC